MFDRGPPPIPEVTQVNVWKQIPTKIRAFIKTKPITVLFLFFIMYLFTKMFLNYF